MAKREANEEKQIQKCNKCGEWKSFEEFPKHKNMKYGIDTTCKECTRERVKKHLEENREEKKKYLNNYYKENKKDIKIKQKEYYIKNREAIRKYWKKYYKEHKEEKKEYLRKYYKTPEGQSAHTASRAKRRSKIKSFNTDITAEFLTNLWEETHTCEVCGKELIDKKDAHLDHIVPLCIGGEHMGYNVRYICSQCNLKRPKDGSDLP